MAQETNGAVMTAPKSEVKLSGSTGKVLDVRGKDKDYVKIEIVLGDAKLRGWTRAATEKQIGDSFTIPFGYVFQPRMGINTAGQTVTVLDVVPAKVA